MKRTGLILLIGLLASAGAFWGAYRFRTAAQCEMLSCSQPELSWLKEEFHLTDAEFARISELHAAYLPACHERCRIIEGQDEKLRQLLAQSTTMTPEIENLLAERAKTRADCEAAMLKHFLEVSRAMPPEPGRRYLAWIQDQTFLQGRGMEESHQMKHEGDK